MCSLGDLNGDGVPDSAVGVPGDDDCGTRVLEAQHRRQQTPSLVAGVTQSSPEKSVRFTGIRSRVSQTAAACGRFPACH